MLKIEQKPTKDFDNNFEVTADTIDEVIAEMLPKIRAKSQAFYTKYLSEELIKKGTAIIDRHAGNGCFYSIVLSPKIRLVVIEDHTLGYIYPINPLNYGVLHTIKQGACQLDLVGFFPINNSKIRLASKRDFDEFRVRFEGYSSERYLFEEESIKQN